MVLPTLRFDRQVKVAPYTLRYDTIQVSKHFVK